MVVEMEVKLAMSRKPAVNEPDGMFPSLMIQEDLSTVAFYLIFKPRAGRR